MLPFRLAKTVRLTRRLLADAPVPDWWMREAVKTQLRLAAGRVRRDDGLVYARVGEFQVAGFSTSSLAYLHNEIFVKLAYWFLPERTDPFIVDGGSNIGMSVLFFKALYPDARVVAFEPAGPAFALLERNVEENDLQGVDVHRSALGSENGEVAFYDEADDPATFRMSTRRDRLPCPRETLVPGRRLSGFVNGPVDLVKLDVEGAEGDVLDDLIESGAIAHVRKLVLEYHHHLAPGDDALAGFLEQLATHGFGYRLSASERIAQRAEGAAEPQDILVYAYRRASTP